MLPLPFFDENKCYLLSLPFTNSLMLLVLENYIQPANFSFRFKPGGLETRTRWAEELMEDDFPYDFCAAGEEKLLSSSLISRSLRSEALE